MIDTALNGKRVVKCDDCHMEIDSGWMLYKVSVDDGRTFHVFDDERHYCDECAEWYECRREFRVCDRCGAVMTEGFCDAEADHICEECFEGWMHECFPAGWRTVEDDGCDGYYEWYEPREQEWCGTGIYWTQWN